MTNPTPTPAMPVAEALAELRQISRLVAVGFRSTATAKRIDAIEATLARAAEDADSAITLLRYFVNAETTLAAPDHNEDRAMIVKAKALLTAIDTARGSKT